MIEKFFIIVSVIVGWFLLYTLILKLGNRILESNRKQEIKKWGMEMTRDYDY